MSAAGWKFIILGPEVGDHGDLAVVGEIEEAEAGLGTVGPGGLDPASCALAFTHDSLHSEVPVVRKALYVEPGRNDLASRHRDDAQGRVRGT